jgi:hypothetical protein
LHYILLAGCGLVSLLAIMVSVLFLAFADSPDAGRGAGRAFWPVVVWTLAVQMIARHLIRQPAVWWHYPLAYLAVASPPVVLIGLTFFIMSMKKRL